MRRAVDALAVLSSLASLLALVGGGGMLLIVENSGERSTGALFAFCGLVAFAATMVLVFAPAERFREPTWRAGAIAAAIIGAMPVAGLAATAFRFTGLPFGSPIPLIDWTIFAAGVALGLGALAILALGYRRAREKELEAARDEVIHMQQIREAQIQLRTALRRADEASADDGEVRVRRV